VFTTHKRITTLFYEFIIIIIIVKWFFFSILFLFEELKSITYVQYVVLIIYKTVDSVCSHEEEITHL